MLAKHPPLVLLLSAWALPLVISLARGPIFSDYISLLGWFAIIGCIAAGGFGILLGGSTREEPMEQYAISTVILLAAFGSAGGILMWLMNGHNATGSLEETRALHVAGLGAYRRPTPYVHALCGGIGMIALAMGAQTKRPVLSVGIALAILIAGWIGVTVYTGGRVDTMLFIAVAVCSLAARLHRRIFNLKGGLKIVAVMTPLFIVNVWFNSIRMDAMLADTTSTERILYRASSLLQSAEGSIFGTDFAMMGTFTLFEYVSDPMFNLDHFVNVEDRPIRYGLHQLSVLAGLIPEYDWLENKKEIDRLYEPLGITWNVWGTAVRDSVADFGVPGAVVMFLVLGIAAGATSGRNGPTGVLHALLLTWLIYSPFYSPIPLRPFQIALAISIIWVTVPTLLQHSGRVARGSKSALA